MADFRALYMEPFGDIAGVPDAILYEEIDNWNNNPRPDFTVTRDQALVLVGSRSGILGELTRMGAHRVNIINGTLWLSVRMGSSSLEKGARTALGAIKGAGAVVSRPAVFAAKALPQIGLIKTVSNVFEGNPWRGSSRTMDKRIKNERAKLSEAVVQVGCAASNAYVANNPGGNAFAAAARPQAGNPAPNANSSILLSLLADTLRNNHGF